MLLVAGGAPRDEFDAEIARLVTRVPHIHSADDAAREISEVFSSLSLAAQAKSLCSVPARRLA